VQQPADRCQPLVAGLLVDVAARLRPRQGGRCHDAGAFGPDHEVADARGRAAGLLEPEVKVVLAQRGERQTATLAPAGELDGGAHALAVVARRGAAGLAAALAAQEMVMQLPGGERADVGAVLAVGQPRQRSGGRALKRGGLLEASGQDAVLDERRAQMHRRLTALDGVERVVRDRQRSGGQLAQRDGALAALKPAQHAVGARRGGERVQVGREPGDGVRVAGRAQLGELVC